MRLSTTQIMTRSLASMLLLSAVSLPSAQARRVFARGDNAVGGAYASQGQYGSRAGARFLGRNQGAGASTGSWAGPQGGTFNRAGGGAYERGVGAFHKGSFNATGPEGATASGKSSNIYNAQTGTGTRTSSVDATSSSGKQYGYTGDTNYTKGQGFKSTINTVNKGDYDVNYTQGSKPVVTSTSQ